MSVQETPQFTPSQVLEAGRRAETEGRGEYALQFYRHIVDNYPGSGEAAAAMSALTRLGANTHPSMANPNPANANLANPSLVNRLGPPPTVPPPPSADPRFDFSLGGPPLNNPFEQGRPYEPPFQQPAGYAPAQQASSPAPYPPGETHAEQALMVDLPAPARDYRTGRLLARMFSWLGGLASLFGLMLLGLSILMPRLVGSLPLIGALGSGSFTSILLIFGGLFQLMIGQLVRAVLDHSTAARDMAAVTRAEAEARYGTPPGRSRRR